MLDLEAQVDLYYKWEIAVNEPEPDLALIASLESEATFHEIDLWELNNFLINAFAASVRYGVADWNPTLHPRGRDGQFIEVFGLVDVFRFENEKGKLEDRARGKVVAIEPARDWKRSKPDSVLVTVELDDGRTVKVRPYHLQASEDPKALVAPFDEPKEKIAAFVDQLGNFLSNLDDTALVAWFKRFAESFPSEKLNPFYHIYGGKDDWWRAIERGDAPALSSGFIAADWNPDLHPRGRDGRFIEVLGLIRLFNFEDSKGNRIGESNGTVRSIKPSNQRGNPDIEVELPDGNIVTVKPNQVESGAEVKARLDKSNPDVADFLEEARTPGYLADYQKYQKNENESGGRPLDFDDWFLEGMPEGGPPSSPESDFETEAPEADEFEIPEIPPPPENINPIGEPVDVEPGELGSKTNPIKTSDPLEAVTALREGKYVELESVDQVSTLLDELAQIANEAKAAGEKAENYDLCLVSVPGTNLFCAESKGIPRINMPQLGGVPLEGTPAASLPANENGEVNISDFYVEFLRRQGIEVTEERRLASHLKASQSELAGTKVAGMMKAMESGNQAAIDNIREASIFVTKDGYVVDGHHRWAAVVGLDAGEGDIEELDMPVRVIDMDIMEVLQSANNFAREMGLPQQAVSQGA